MCAFLIFNKLFACILSLACWASMFCTEGEKRSLGDRSWTLLVLCSAEFLGKSDEKPFSPADVAEPIRVFILNYFAYVLCAALAEPFKRLVDVVHGEHDAG